MTDASLPPAVPDGRARAVVDAVRPAVDGGRFAVKRIVGDRMDVEAHCFADGHDALRVMLRWREEDASDWNEVEMQAQGNDVWRGSFALERIGRYRYTVVAWVDHFLSWRSEFARREDPADLRLAAWVGAGLVGEAARRSMTRWRRSPCGIRTGGLPRHGRWRCRSWWIANGLATPPGTNCSRARRRTRPGATAR
jgi:starch synthase (maltosyl-transferring)